MREAGAVSPAPASPALYLPKTVRPGWSDTCTRGVVREGAPSQWMRSAGEGKSLRTAGAD
jgi:hypothetical protein